MMGARWLGRRGLTALAVPLVLAGVLTVAGPGRASASACVSWTGTQPPAPNSPPHYRFNGVTVLSPCNAWAVGSYSSPTGDQTLIDHWNGSQWKQVASPSPGSIGNELSRVAAVSASNIWAVGSYYSPTAAADQTLVLHWNGTAWKQMASPSPGSIGNGLSGVATVSASNAWAVGSYTSGTAFQTLILHWNGTAWKKVASPNPAGSSADNVLNGVSAVSASNAWAVGYYYSPTAGGDKTFILHWNGTAWKKVASPNPGTESNVLSGVTAISASNAWAVGVHWTSSGAATLVLHWNGTAWKHVASPSPGSIGNELNGVTALSSGNAWAVGEYDDPGKGRTLVLHWNGTAWQRVASPNFGTFPGQNVLTSVAASSATNIWAVGFDDVDTDADPDGYTEQGIAIHCC